MTITSHTLKLARESTRLLHESTPAGVPVDYDWRHKPVVHAGLQVPAGCAALTGWGHAFISATAKREGAIVQVRNMGTYSRYSRGGGIWHSCQLGPVSGGRYRADYAGNVSEPLGEFDAASLQAGQALHWWPAHGRYGLAQELITTGLIVRFQARTNVASTVLIGAGADYWTTTTAAWADHTTNPPVGMGRLRFCTTRWQWFCFGVFK